MTINRNTPPPPPPHRVRRFDYMFEALLDAPDEWGSVSLSALPCRTAQSKQVALHAMATQCSLKIQTATRRDTAFLWLRPAPDETKEDANTTVAQNEGAAA